MKTVKILLIGEPGSGKSTVKKTIKKLMEEHFGVLPVKESEESPCKLEYNSDEVITRINGL